MLKPRTVEVNYARARTAMAPAIARANGPLVVAAPVISAGADVGTTDEDEDEDGVTVGTVVRIVVGGRVTTGATVEVEVTGRGTVE